jgi:hypothetical protein
MAAQTTYGTVMGEAIAGLIYDMRNITVESYAAEGGSIPFGRAVAPGTDVRKQVKLPTASGQGFRGVALLEQAHAQDLTTGVAQYLVTETVNVMRKGAVWVQVAGAVAENAPAFYINSGANAGMFDDLDDATTDPTSSGGSRAGVFRTAASASGLAVLEIDL